MQASSSPAAVADSLSGRKILVLEDEALVAMMIEDMLLDLGCEVIGPFARVEQALEYLADGRQGVDAALLDVNVAGERSYPVAEALAAQGAPFLFATGYGDGGLPDPWTGSPTLNKPFMMGQMVEALSGVLKT